MKYFQSDSKAPQCQSSRSNQPLCITNSNSASKYIKELVINYKRYAKLSVITTHFFAADYSFIGFIPTQWAQHYSPWSLQQDGDAPHILLSNLPASNKPGRVLYLYQYLRLGVCFNKLWASTLNIKMSLYHMSMFAHDVSWLVKRNRACSIAILTLYYIIVRIRHKD